MPASMSHRLLIIVANVYQPLPHYWCPVLHCQFHNLHNGYVCLINDRLNLYSSSEVCKILFEHNYSGVQT